MSSEARDPWDQLWGDVDALGSSVSRSQAVNINALQLREQAQRLVQLYFREVRPDLLSLGIDEQKLGAADGEMQALLLLSQGRNAKRSYLRVIRAFARERFPLSSARERLIGASRGQLHPSISGLSATERGVVDTLAAMLPEAAKSYEQATVDLSDSGRISWRGTAVELREVVREVLDALAPDVDVVGEAGFKLEKDRIAPTMKQKASFVLRSRGLSGTSRKAPQDATAIVDELTASFVRSTYERGSASTHGSADKVEVERLKMYVDIVLSELLEATI